VFIQSWISFWASLVSVSSLLFAGIEATAEAVLAIFLILVQVSGAKRPAEAIQEQPLTSKTGGLLCWRAD
jgi:hypothetical protein